MTKPLCAATGDMHFTPSSLELPSAVLGQMIPVCKRLQIPMLLNGDTLDTKAIIRGECANRLISILEDSEVFTIINTGNHDLLHQKSKDSSLNFLRPYATVVSKPMFVDQIDSYVIPYQDSLDTFQAILKDIPYYSRVFIHQGIVGADLGHYVLDPSAVPKDMLADYRVIASHYHKAQDIKCGRPRKGAVGLASYLGTPYTQSFGEANDPPKGFAVLHDDGTLERIPTHLRKHVIVEICKDDCASIVNDIDAGDLVWLKYTGTRSELTTLSKKYFSDWLFDGRRDFKLDLIPTDSSPLEAKTETMTGYEILDALIDAEPDSVDYKAELKKLWREALG